MEQGLRDSFLSIIEQLEKLLRTNAAQLSMETLTNAAYYFCKF